MVNASTCKHTDCGAALALHTFWNCARVAENCARVAGNCARVAGSFSLEHLTKAARQPQKVLELDLSRKKTLECQKLSGALLCVSKGPPGNPVSDFGNPLKRSKSWPRKNIPQNHPGNSDGQASEENQGASLSLSRARRFRKQNKQNNTGRSQDSQANAGDSCGFFFFYRFPTGCRCGQIRVEVHSISKVFLACQLLELIPKVITLSITNMAPVGEYLEDQFPVETPPVGCHVSGRGGNMYEYIIVQSCLVQCMLSGGGLAGWQGNHVKASRVFMKIYTGPPTQNTHLFQGIWENLVSMENTTLFSPEGRHDTLKNEGIWSRGDWSGVFRQVGTGVVFLGQRLSATWHKKQLRQVREGPVVFPMFFKAWNRFLTPLRPIYPRRYSRVQLPKPRIQAIHWGVT